MAAKSFREDLRRARLEAISAPKPVLTPKTKAADVKPVVVVEPKITKINKETE
jgi:hypothetical protein